MQLKKINTESKAYKLIKAGYSWTAAFGSMMAVSNVLVPFAQALWANNRKLRLLSYLGASTLNCATGIAGLSIGAISIDSFAYTYNHIVDKINGEDNAESTNFEDAQMMSDSLMEDFADSIQSSELFEFESEDKAKAACDELAYMISQQGYATLFEHCALNYPSCLIGDNPIDFMMAVGWEDLAGTEIIAQENGKWLLKLPKMEKLDFSKYHNYFSDDTMTELKTPEKNEETE